MANNNDLNIRINVTTAGNQSIEQTANEIDNLTESTQELGEQSEESSQGVEQLNEQVDDTSSVASDAVSGLKDLVGSLVDMATSGGGATAILAGLLGAITGIISASVAVTQETAAYAKEQQNLQRATGVSASLIATLSEGLKRNGGSADDTADSLLQLGGVIKNAVADPASDAARNFDSLGIAVKDASGKALGIEEVFRAIDKSAQGAGLSQDKLVTLAGILGEDAAKKLLPLIGTFGDLEKQVQQTGLVLGDDVAAQATKLNSGLAEIEAVLKGVALSIGGDFLPAFNEVITQFKIGFETLSKNEDLKIGFQALINLVKDFISSAGPDLVTLVQGLIEFIGRLGIVVAFVSEGFTSLKESIVGKTEASKADTETTNLQAQAIGQATQQAAAQTAVIDGLKKSTEQLNAVQQANLGIQKALTDLRVQSLEIAKQKGLISEEKFSKQSLQLQVDTAKEGLRIANDLVKEKEKIAKEEKTKLGKVRIETETELKAAQQASIIAAKELSKAQFDLQTKPVKDAVEENLKTLEKENQERKINVLALTAFIKQQEKEKVISHEQATQEIIDITRGAVQDEIDAIDKVLKNQNLSAQKREELEKKRKDLTLEIDKIDIESSGKVKDARISDLEDTINKRNTLLKQAQTLEQNAIDEITQRVQKGQLTKEQAIRQTAQLELNLLNISLITQLNNLQAIQKDKANVKDADNKIFDINQEITRIQKEQVALQKLLRGEVDNTSAAVNKVANAYNNVSQSQERVKAGEDAINERIEQSADRAKSAAAIIADTGAKIAAGGEYINSQTASIEDLTAAIDELREHAKVIDLTFAFPGKDVVVADINASADKLNQDLINRTQRVQLEAAQKRAEEELKVAQEKNNQLLELAKKLEEDKKKAQEKELEDLRRNNEAIEKENIDFVTREQERNEKLNENKTKASEEYAKREKEIQDNLAKQEEERARKLAETKEKIQLDSADKLNDIQRRGLVERANLEAAINAEKDPKKKAELEKQLAEVTAKGREKENKEKQKQAELDKLLTENLSEEELRARQEAIERKYKLEEDADEQRQALIKSGNKKALEEFDKLIAEQKKRDEERLASELKRILDAAKRKKEQEEKERAERKAAYDQRLKDLQDAFDKERADAEKQHGQRLSDLKKQQGEIKAEYKKTLDEITKNAVDSAAQIGVTGKAIADAFNLGDEAAKKYLATLGQIGQAQSGIASGGSSPTSTQGASNASSGGFGNTTGGLPSSGSSSGFGGAGSSGSGGSIGNSANPSGSTTTGSTTSNPSSSSNTSGKSKNEAKKERAEEINNLPKTASSSSEYKTNSNIIFDNYAAFIKERKRNSSIFVKHFDIFRLMTVDYFKQSKVSVDPKLANSFGLPFGILDPAAQAMENADQKGSKEAFNKVVDTVITYVENAKKQQAKADSLGSSGDIGTKGSDIITPGLSSDPKSASGSTKGNVISSANQSGSVEPPKETKDPVLAARDAALDTGYEGEGAESRSAQAERAAAQTAKNQNAGIQANIPITVPVTVVNQMSAEQIDQAVMRSVAKALQDQGIGKQVTNTVNGNNTQSNFNRNPVKFIAK